MTDVFVEKLGALGLIVLARAKAMNALNTPMCETMTAALNDFAADPAIKHVAIRSSENGRFFCAGGDIRALYTHIKDGIYDEALTFFRTEYRLNRLIAQYPKPFIALIDGVVMGGGVGISAHGAYRVVSENTLFAMPEVAIGFFPDVGVSHILARLQHQLGRYLAITGDRLKAGDMMYCGLATHFVQAENFAPLVEALNKGDDAKIILNAHSSAAPESKLVQNIGKIEKYFSATSIDEIKTKLEASKDDDFALHCLNLMAARSPTSMKLAFAQLERVAHLDIEGALQLDYVIAQHVLTQHDFREGVRALLIDKDQAPAWSPANLEDITPQSIETYFSQPSTLTFSE